MKLIDTQANWAASNPVLPAGDIAKNFDTNDFKIGDGITRWADLPIAGYEEANRDVLDGIVEIDTLFLNPAVPEHWNDGTVRITLNGIEHNVTLVEGEDYIAAISAATFPGWMAYAQEGSVVFVKTTSGACTPPSYADISETGVGGYFEVTTAGANGKADINVLGKLVQMPTSDDIGAIAVEKIGAEGGVAPFDGTYSKDEVDALVVGLLDDRGNFDASNDTFPTTGGSGTAGSISKGDLWYISVAGTLGGVDVIIGDAIRALVDDPETNEWGIMQMGLGYVPENSANKVTSLSSGSTDTQYPTAKLVYDQLEGKQANGSYEVVANKEDTTLDTSATKFPTNRLVKEYIDGKSFITGQRFTLKTNSIIHPITGSGLTMFLAPAPCKIISITERHSVASAVEGQSTIEIKAVLIIGSALTMVIVDCHSAINTDVTVNAANFAESGSDMLYSAGDEITANIGGEIGSYAGGAITLIMEWL